MVKHIAKNGSSSLAKKTLKTNADQGFFARQRGYFVDAWADLWRWRTLGEIGLDLGLLFIVLVLFMVVQVSFNAIAAPLAPVLQAIGQLESEGMYNPVSNEQRLALLAQYQPDLNGILLRIGLLSLALFFVFIVCYALLTTFIWASVRDETFSKRRFLKNLLLSAAWLTLLFAIPFGLTFADANLAAIAFLVLGTFTLLFLPLFYAMKTWRPSLATFFWRPFGNYLFLVLIAILTWVLAVTVIGLTSSIHELLYASLFFVWSLVFLAWVRHAIKRFVHGMVPDA